MRGRGRLAAPHSQGPLWPRLDMPQLNTPPLGHTKSRSSDGPNESRNANSSLIFMLVKRAAFCVPTWIAAFAIVAPPAPASFGLQSFESKILNEDGSPAVQAGSHPFAVTTSFKFNRREGGAGPIPEGAVEA